ncbi:MAG TPA: hypothetical protein VF461_19725 [Gemmatimonadaceae bacterium]
MSLSPRSLRLCYLLVIIHLAAWPEVGHAQGRPSGINTRLWLEVGFEGGQQAHRCMTCDASTTIGGGSATAAAGVTLPQGFGIGLLARGFNQFGFESSLQSRYVIALAQYAPPAASLLTLNVGLGHGRYFSNTISDEIEGGGTAFYAGTALRLPPRTGLAMSLTADVLQSIDGTPRSHPRLLSIGVSVAVATPSISPIH